MGITQIYYVNAAMFYKHWLMLIPSAQGVENTSLEMLPSLPVLVVVLVLVWDLIRA